MIRKGMPQSTLWGYDPMGGYRFSLSQQTRNAFARRSCSNKKIERDDDSKKSHHALASDRRAPPRREGAANAESGAPRSLFELKGLVFALVVDGRAPDLVRGLVFGAAVAEGSPETHIEIARVLQRVDQLLSLELRACLFQGIAQDTGCDKAFKRHVVRRLARKKFVQRGLVFENRARIAGDCRDHLSHDDAGG